MQAVEAMKDAIYQRMQQLFQTEDLPQKTLYDAARHTLLNPGKYLRPLLTLIVAQAFGVPFERALDPALSIELIHTYSCIHDDLPAMDNDVLRRGLPTLHVAFDEGMAILAGDFLLTYAFELIAKAPFEPKVIVMMIEKVAQKAGAQGMIGGQVLDLESENQQVAPERLALIHQLKTGSMIEAAVLMGALMGNATTDEKEHLSAFSLAFGRAFQMVDDLLDVYGKEDEIGKKTGSDAKRNVANSLSLLGFEKALESAKETFSKALTHLELIARDFSELTRFTHAILEQGFAKIRV